ncbi:hypothetical protein SAMN04487939_105167 [Lysobacter sp. yr284]|uniref:hypothetical protein n=1 Tax=Lysobacter sp. yr284 TaxID=1761791 RepID=UPI00089CC4EC|nr:hypothetical protein [Lysobacter sp. yr284]SDY71813.1 hypothetical protein SAMN04487939_105167 [Lysobacter sp. yr284]
MAAVSLLEMLLLRRALARPAPAPADADEPAPPTDQEPAVPNEFEFLDKHYDPTDLPEVAAQTALERFGNYPNARTSTVIFGVSWQALTDSIQHAVLNYNNGGIFDTSVAATLSEDTRQWQIMLTGLRYVNATRTMVAGRPQYTVGEYSNGSIFLNAEALGGQLLGEVVHLSNGFGDWVQNVELKNPPSY